MRREIEEKLKKWRDEAFPIPLILRGARQVGKTYTVEWFGKIHFEDFISVNFELNPELKACFEQLDPRRIISELELLKGQKIVPGKTLLFLDEIQECPRAIMALRYFKEQLPKLHVIGAGSLLEFNLHDEQFSFPVGRVQFLQLIPLSFREYLNAKKEINLLEFLKKTTLSNPPSEAVHEHLLKLVREYSFIGGMPAVVQLYLERDSILDCRHLQNALFQAYKNDFGKYASKTQHKYLQRLYERAPNIVAKHFKYTKIDPEIRSRDLKGALEDLCHAGLIHQVFYTSANGLPLQATISEKKFKLLFLDIGLLQSALQLDISLIGEKDFHQINEGTLAEQFVGQELLAYQDHFQEKRIYFWERGKGSSAAEIDFLISLKSKIIPIEVKSSSIGHLKSLQLFLKEKNMNFGVRISKHPLSMKEKVLSIPFYLIGELQRLVEDVSIVN